MRGLPAGPAQPSGAARTPRWRTAAAGGLWGQEGDPEEAEAPGMPGEMGTWPRGCGGCVSPILPTASSSAAGALKNHREMESVQKRATEMADKNAFVVQVHISAQAWV